MKKLFFPGACLLLLASAPAKAQTGAAPVVLVETYYVGVSTTMHIAITRAEGQTEEVEVPDAGNVKNHHATQGLHRQLAKLVQEGYTLKAAYDTGYGRVLIYEKRP